MKKLMLSLCLSLACAAAAMADTYLGYTNTHFERTGGVRLGNSEKQGLAIKLTSEKLDRLRGKRVLGVRAVFGTSNMDGLEFFVATSLDGEPLYSQAFGGGSPSWKEFRFDTPVDIGDADELYVGYTLTCMQSYKPLQFDGSKGLSGRSFYYTGSGWLDCQGNGADLGCPNIQVIVDDADFTDITLKDLSAGGYYVAGQTYGHGGQVLNFGTVPIGSFDVSFSIGGGEPLVRKNVAQLVAGLKATPGIRRVTLTTNAVLLAEQLPALLDAGLDSVNISLDTLRPEVFRQITARDDFAAVQAGLQAALESGLPVKLNCVPQAGVNEGELETLAALAKDNALQVRFIEMMPIGYGAAMPCISGPELRARFARRWPELAPLSAAQEHALGDGPAVYYTVPGWQGSIGFIAAVHGKFCASCNRVRLTSQGFLRPCLASETGCDLRALLRSGADDAQLLAAIRETIWAKPREHHFNDSSMPATRGMYRIGG